MSSSERSWQNVLCGNPGSTPHSRYGHTCAVYKDCLYIFGGCGISGRLNDFCGFSLTSRMWTVIPAKGSVPKPRVYHVSVVYKDSFYVFGGDHRSSKNDLLEFNFLTRTWSTVAVNGGTAPTPRDGHSAVVYGNSMYCFGGRQNSSDSQCMNDLHEFNFETRTWTHVPATGTVPSARCFSSLVVFQKTCILFGGCLRSNYFNDVHVFDFALRSWSKLVADGPAPIRRSNHVAVIHSNAMYVFGGYDGSSRMKDVHMLIMGTCSGDAFTDCIMTHHHAPAASHNWQTIKFEGDPPCQRDDHAAAVCGSSIFVFGGFGNNSSMQDFIRFDFAMAENQKSTLISDLRLLVNNEAMSDVTFVVEGIPIYAHKLLCMRCDYFKAMLSSEMLESHTGKIVIEDVRRPVFLLFLEYLYCDGISEASLENTMELIAFADKYGEDRLKSTCEQRMLASMCEENAASILYAADLFNAALLRAKCVSFMLEHFDTVSKTTAFEEMSHKNVNLVVELLKRR